MKLIVDNFLSLSCYTRIIAFVRQVNALMKQCPRKQKNEWQLRQENFKKLCFDFSVKPVPLLYSNLMEKS